MPGLVRQMDSTLSYVFAAGAGLLIAHFLSRAQAVRQTGNTAATALVVSQVLKQSQWSEHEQAMLRQLREPVSGS
jgi:hypothetical protein